MNTHHCFGLLLLLLIGCGTLHSQTTTEQQGKKSLPQKADTMMVLYDYTPIYQSATYKAEVVGDKQQGEIVVVVEKVGEFRRIQLPSGAGFIARVNLRDISRTRPKPPNTTGSDTATADSITTSSPLPRTPRQQPTEQHCKGITKKGKPCSRNAEQGSEYCWQHRPTLERTDGTNHEKTTGGKP